MRSLLLLPLLGACAPKRIEIQYQTDDLLGARRADESRPVLIGLYPLTHIPADLPEADCAVTEREAGVLEAWEDALAGELPPLSALPGTKKGELAYDLPKGARWLLMVPYYQYKCELVQSGQVDDVDEWAVLRLPVVQRPLWFGMRAYEITLPWDDLDAEYARRQRGCIDRDPHHVLWPWCS